MYYRYDYSGFTCICLMPGKKISQYYMKNDKELSNLSHNLPAIMRILKNRNHECIGPKKKTMSIGVKNCRIACRASQRGQKNRF